jgi:predicted RNase H-like HicB family nuclease
MATSATHKKRRSAIDRPFEARVLRRARAIAARYQIKLWREDGHWYGAGIEEPGAMGDGRTIQQAVKSTQAALVTCVAYLIESERPVVEPMIDQERRARRKAG